MSGPARFVWTCSIVCLFLSAGCTYVEPVDEQATHEAFPFLREGQTTKKTVLDRFGTPDSEYEGGRIITYRAGCAVSRPRLVLVQPPCKLVTYRLVLVFGPDSVLESHSAVLER